MGLVSKKCVDFVKGFEGYEPIVKNDMVGVPTLGYGMTGQEIKGLRYVTEGQASKMLEELLNSKYALPIKNSLVAKGVMLNQNQFDAITSMAYNIGVGGLLGSKLYKNICSGSRDRNLLTSNFRSWDMAGGKHTEGLLRRRTEEAQMFFNTNSMGANYVMAKDNKILLLQKVCNRVGIRGANGKVLVEDGLGGANTTAAKAKLKVYIANVTK